MKNLPSIIRELKVSNIIDNNDLMLLAEFVKENYPSAKGEHFNSILKLLIKVVINNFISNNGVIEAFDFDDKGNKIVKRFKLKSIIDKQLKTSKS